MKNYLLLVLAMTIVNLQAAVADTASLNEQLWQELNESYTSYYAEKKLPDNTDKIKDLIERGADVNFPNPYQLTRGWGGKTTSMPGETPLILAVRTENVPLAEFLLSKKANPNLAHFYFGKAPLFYTVMGDKPKPKLAELLLRYGADVNIKDEKDRTPLGVLKMNLLADHPIIDILQAHGAR